MPLWAQHVVVSCLVAACLIVVARNAIRQLLRGCGTCSGCRRPEPGHMEDRMIFLPAEFLTRRRRRYATGPIGCPSESSASLGRGSR